VAVGETSILTLLSERAALQGDDTAVTFVDYETNWDGVPESLTYSQLHRRTGILARELRGVGSLGDRALVLAPQGLDYIVAFFGAMQAGRIAVPLAVPLGGVSDERVSSVLQDASPTVVLTTSAVAGAVAGYVDAHYANIQPGQAPPSIVEVDNLSLDAPGRTHAQPESLTETAYLQYTSGSTRQPAGVMMSHRNLLANFEQLMSGYFADFGNVVPEGSTIVSWLPFYHDMGLYLGVCAPVLAGVPARSPSSNGRPAGSSSWRPTAEPTRQHRISRSSWRSARPLTAIWPAWTSPMFLSSSREASGSIRPLSSGSPGTSAGSTWGRR
jgi:fatty acid CoA ligase FadD28